MPIITVTIDTDKQCVVPLELTHKMRDAFYALEEVSMASAAWEAMLSAAPEPTVKEAHLTDAEKFKFFHERKFIEPTVIHMKEVLPCPFCGSEKSHETGGKQKCDGCGARVHWDRWNTRAPDPRDEVITRLMEALTHTQKYLEDRGVRTKGEIGRTIILPNIDAAIAYANETLGRK